VTKEFVDIQCTACMQKLFGVIGHDGQYWVEPHVCNAPAQQATKDAITLLETEIEFISGDCGKVDLNVVASKLREAVKLLHQ